MVNPKLMYKEENIFTLNTDTRRLFQVIYHEQHKEEKDEDEVPKIKVSELISKMSFYYEKIRNAVDYKEEYLLRKNAIARILKRQLVIEGAITAQVSRSHDIAKHLLIELIRAAYLPNNKLPETKIDEIGKVIEKYVLLRRYSLDYGKENNKMTGDLTKWIITMAACDIEERLGRNKVEQVVISDLYDNLSKNIQLREDSEYKEDREIQIYVAIHRLFLRYDNDLTSFLLFKYYNSNWRDASEDDIKKIGKNIDVLERAIQNQLNHPLVKQINKIVRRYTGFFSILTDVIAENPVEIYESIKTDPKAFPRNIKNICLKRYKQAKAKLWRAAARSIIYIFITKSIFAAALEVPASQWFGEEVNPLALAINVSFPAALLFLAVLFTKLPSEANTNKIIEGINGVSFTEYERKDPFILQRPVKRSGLANAVFGVIYTITFLISVYAVIWALDKIGFHWVSTTIFLFFLAFVSFFVIRIRKNVRELIVVEPKENVITFFIDFFYVPIVSAGKWLSEKFSRINVFVFILDFIIEAPFKIFVEIAEEWTKYVKERKEEIV
jgi:hypothetical protein